MQYIGAKRTLTPKESYEYCPNECKLEGGGEDVEDEGIEYEAHSGCAAINRLSERARLPAEVEGEVHGVKVEEYSARQVTNRALGYLGEDRIPQLVKQGHPYPGGPILIARLLSSTHVSNTYWGTYTPV